MTLLLSVVLMAALLLLLYAATALIQDKRLLSSAPKDVHAAMTDHEERFPGARVLGCFLLVVSALMFMGAVIYGGWDGIQKGYTFWRFFGRYLIMLYLEKAFDILFCDWFLLTKSHFFQHYYPETEGCAGYHQFGFNRREQLMRIVMYPFCAALTAWICTLF